MPSATKCQLLEKSALKIPQDFILIRVKKLAVALRLKVVMEMQIISTRVVTVWSFVSRPVSYMTKENNDTNFILYFILIACLPGEHALRDKNGIKTCVPTNGNISCSAGFTCRRDNLYDRNVCCGSKPSPWLYWISKIYPPLFSFFCFKEVCPEDSKPYVESGIAKEVRFCEIGASGSCPSPYICAPNFDENSNYCCAPASDGKIFLNFYKLYVPISISFHVIL